MSKPKRERSLADNEAKAIARMLRVSPQKLNLVAQLIRGRKASAALADLQFSRKRIAVDVKKCLESAIANAENNHDLEVDDLVRYGSITEDMIRFLEACVRGRLNVVVSGGTGSGKTTTLNILSSFIPGDERIVTIEDAAELQLRQEHVVTLETRPANVEGRGRITIRDLVINALRMRPDRIVIGECRGGEALDMLQAMNTGHDGSLTTLHANNARDCISRLETMVLMAGAELPSRAIREQIGSAVNVIVQQSRLRDGARKIVGITEVLGTDDNNDVKLQDLFAFRQTGIDQDGRVVGSFMPTGNIPTFLEYLRSSGERVPETIFQPVHVVEATS